jgi:hypothetical protein
MAAAREHQPGRDAALAMASPSGDSQEETGGGGGPGPIVSGRESAETGPRATRTAWRVVSPLAGGAEGRVTARV